jgi:hypothetical protein
MSEARIILSIIVLLVGECNCHRGLIGGFDRKLHLLMTNVYVSIDVGVLVNVDVSVGVNVPIGVNVSVNVNVFTVVIPAAVTVSVMVVAVS